MNDIGVLLLLALPASGKSEVRKYLGTFRAETLRTEFNLHDPVQLDDYPYVEFMRAVDEVADGLLHYGCVFFEAHDRPFLDPYEWLALVELLNQDFLARGGEEWSEPRSAAMAMFQRIDEAERCAQARRKLSRLPRDVLETMAAHLEDRARKMFAVRRQTLQSWHDGQTLIIEFSRGFGLGMPDDPPRGYEAALRQLHPSILAEASILYVSVDPAESRRKNAERAVPPPGCTDTGIYHGVPTSVMLGEYARDDMSRLIEEGGHGDLIVIPAHGMHHHLPVAVLDNRRDLTTFVRGDPKDWPADKALVLHTALREALRPLPRRQGCSF